MELDWDLLQVEDDVGRVLDDASKTTSRRRRTFARIDPNQFGRRIPVSRRRYFSSDPRFVLSARTNGRSAAMSLIGGTYGIFSHDLKGVPPNQVGLYNDQLAFAVATGGTFDYAITPKAVHPPDS